MYDRTPLHDGTCTFRHMRAHELIADEQGGAGGEDGAQVGPSVASPASRVPRLVTRLFDFVLPCF